MASNKHFLQTRGTLVVQQSGFQVYNLYLVDLSLFAHTHMSDEVAKTSNAGRIFLFEGEFWEVIQYFGLPVMEHWQVNFYSYFLGEKQIIDKLIIGHAIDKFQIQFKQPKVQLFTNFKNAKWMVLLDFGGYNPPPPKFFYNLYIRCNPLEIMEKFKFTCSMVDWDRVFKENYPKIEENLKNWRVHNNQGEWREAKKAYHPALSEAFMEQAAKKKEVEDIMNEVAEYEEEELRKKVRIEEQ